MVSVFQWWGKRLQPGSKQSTRAQTCRRPVCISSHGWSHLRCCYHEGQAKSSKTTCMEPIFSLSCAKIWQDLLLILWFITFVSLTYLHPSFLRGNTEHEEAQSEFGHFLWTQGNHPAYYWCRRKASVGRVLGSITSKPVLLRLLMFSLRQETSEFDPLLAFLTTSACSQDQQKVLHLWNMQGNSRFSCLALAKLTKGIKRHP